jgi:hypothetical protein
MTLTLLLPTFSKFCGIIGLSLDIYAIFRLFKLEPKPINEANENVFEATLGDWTDMEKVKRICSELNKNVQYMRFESQHLRRKAKSFKNIILIGFVLQVLSIILSFFYN